MLNWCLNHRLFIVGSLIVIALFGAFVYSRLHSEFIPKEDYGRIEIGMSAPGGTTLNYTEGYANQIISRLISEFSQQKY